MRALLVSSRFPFPPFTGDRLRLLIWLEALQDDHVTLVSPPGELPPEHERVTHIAANKSLSAALRNLILVLRGRLPLHTLIAASWNWRGALRRAAKEGEYDVAIIFLSRFHPFVFRGAPAKRKILEAIDSLAVSMTERARESSTLGRLFWRLEARLTTRLENRLALQYEKVLLVSLEEARYFGKRASAVPNGVEILPLREDGERLYDFAFWGRLAYFANEDAVRVLLTRIWPVIRAQVPSARLLIAGADAPSSVSRESGRNGIDVVSPMLNRPHVLRNVRIALFPLRFGTGQSNKVLEAGEAGCAIVSTSAGVRGLDDLAPLCIIDDEPERLAGKAIALASDDSRRRLLGGQLRTLVEQRYDRKRTLQKLREIALQEGSID